MKTHLPYFILLFLLVSCSEPKLKLRAPEVNFDQKKMVKDSLRKDTDGVQLEQLAH